MKSIIGFGLGIALALVVAGPATAQVGEVSRTTLAEPDASFPEPFSNVAGLRELADGRVLVSDRLEIALRLLDFEAGTLEEIGHEGAGPGEFRMPGDLWRLPGDSTLLTDLGNMRMTVVSPTGVLSGSESLVRPEGIFLFPRGTDAEGRVYFDLAGSMSMQPGESPPDSIAIARFDPNDGTVDTVGLLPREQTRQMQLGGGGVSFSGSGTLPFEPVDAWAAAPDGRVAVARGDDYHVEWLSGSGERVVGPSVEYEPIRVTREDKEAWADRMSAGSFVTVMSREGSGGRTINIPRPDIDEMEWPEVKSAFPRGAVSVTPDGAAWVERYVAHGEPQTFDVFDSEGRRVERVVLPEGRTLVGFGAGTLYAVRVDENDLQWLERYRR